MGIPAPLSIYLLDLSGFLAREQFLFRNSLPQVLFFFVDFAKGTYLIKYCPIIHSQSEHIHVRRYHDSNMNMIPSLLNSIHSDAFFLIEKKNKEKETDRITIS